MEHKKIPVRKIKQEFFKLGNLERLLEWWFIDSSSSVSSSRAGVILPSVSLQSARLQPKIEGASA